MEYTDPIHDIQVLENHLHYACHAVQSEPDILERIHQSIATHNSHFEYML